MATDLFKQLPIEKVECDVVDGALAAVGNGTMQRVTDGQYGAAIQIQRPRVKALVESEAMKECEKLGESAFYGWGVGKDRIEGPSIKCANVLAGLWGNNTVRMEPVQDLGDSWVFTAAFIDLETGATMTRQFRQSKTSKVYGKHDEERKADMRFQIGQSKASRNVILNALPEWLVRRAMDAAKLGVRKRIEAHIAQNGIEHARDLVVKALGKVGVKPEAIAAKMNRSTVSSLTIDDLVTLNGDIRAIDEGSEAPIALFPAANATEGPTLPDRIKAAQHPPKSEPAESPAPEPPGEPGQPDSAEPTIADPAEAAKNACNDLKIEILDMAKHVGKDRMDEIRKGCGISILSRCVDMEKLTKLRNELQAEANVKVSTT